MTNVTPLDERMRLHVGGQLTWPEPKLKKHCDTCRFYFTADSANSAKGRCDLVKAHQRVTGKQFTGRDAIACPKYEAGKHRGNET